jgi:L-2,4-diaminobutyrate decarboxylase
MNDEEIERFRSEGHALIDLLARHLRESTTREELPVMPWASPRENELRFPGAFPKQGGASLVELVERVLPASTRLHTPRCVGHQVAAPSWQAPLAAMVGALLNNGMAIYEMGLVNAPTERAAVRFLTGALGWGEAADGVLTSGGSLGNLTALLAAREIRAPEEEPRRLCVLASEQAHYCVERATRALGMGEGGVIPVPVDGRFRLETAALPGALEEARRRGRRPLAVVGSACSTATGSFDPLRATGEFCRQHGLWFHVDGAHGAAAALSPSYAPLLDGVELADSLVWDAHKMMELPALITAVLFREGARSYQIFSQRASYLFGEERPWWDIGLRTFECTKRAMGFELYAALLCRGTEAFARHVTSRFDLARSFARLLEEAPDFELATGPDANIVCFRHTPAEVDDLDALQERVRERIVRSGRFYLVKTRLGDHVWLRVSLMNPETCLDHLADLLEEIRKQASQG